MFGEAPSCSSALVLEWSMAVLVTCVAAMRLHALGAACIPSGCSVSGRTFHSDSMGFQLSYVSLVRRPGVYLFSTAWHGASGIIRRGKGALHSIERRGLFVAVCTAAA